ncbi:MAG: PEP-utilizing enzyme [Patescibacteria group bacterium]|jgi:phosphohistidine swiveling domain-containing protein
MIKNKKIVWFQISQRQRMSPFPNYLSMESIGKELKNVVGTTYKRIVQMFEENHMYLYFDKADHERVGKHVLKIVFLKPDMFIKLGKTQKAFAKSFYGFLKKNNNLKKLRTVSNSRLAGLHEEYERRYKQVYSHYFPILAIENYLFKYLQEYIAAKESDTKKAAHYVDALITETKAMVSRQETLAALKICKIINKRKKWADYFMGNVINTTSSIQKDKELLRLIKNHERKFFWITRDYDDPVLTYEDFIIRFKKHLKRNPGNILEKMLIKEKEIDTKINEIQDKLKIDKKHQRLFQTMREGIYYKELRKSIVSQTLYYYDPILMEIARRGGLSMRQARHLRTAEVRPMLTKDLDMSNILNERIKLCAFIMENGKTSLFTGEKAKQYYKKFVEVDKNVKELVGMAVSPGVAKGPVKIVINPDSFHKVKRGDIICTLQATPVFTQVLSIASALICDGGPGITSHPATLAREAGIPGIIGLRMTTKILKDGQIVAVDGNTGILKIK